MSSDKISLSVKTIQKYFITKLYLVNCIPENIKVVKMIKGYKEGPIYKLIHGDSNLVCSYPTPVLT